MRAVAFDEDAIARYSSRAERDAAAPRLVELLLARWQLRSPRPLGGGQAGIVLGVRTADGERAVLKLAFPHPEAVWEPVALQLLPRDLAPAILRMDRFAWALLLERVRPGRPLWQSGLPLERALEVGARVHARIAAVSPPVPSVPRLAEQYGTLVTGADERLPRHAARLAEIGIAEGAVADGLASARALLASDAASTLVHGDFNPGNLLSSEGGAAGARTLGSPVHAAATRAARRRENGAAHGHWRVIDPKPLVGDPAFDFHPLVRDLVHVAGGDPLGTPLAPLLAVVAEAPGLDGRRIAAWGAARAAIHVVWGMDDGDAEVARREAAWLTAWSRLA